MFDGHLYAAITDAEKFEDWCHVFRYAGGKQWEDCGRVGDRRTHGVGPMVVHRGSLYAATWTYDWNRVGIQQPLDDFCCVYRYAGDKRWEDCGQPGQCRRLFGLASFRGGLYVTAEDGRCYVYAGERTWRECGRFPNYAHPLGIHDGKLYAGVLNPAGVWAFDGQRWESLGNPQGSEDRCDQVHALEVFRGRLHVTTWPRGHVVRLEPDNRWADCGRLGDALEINALNVYNGQLYGGTIPRAEVFRYNPLAAPGVPVEALPPEPKPQRRVRRLAPPPEPASPAWTSVRRFLDPAGYEFQTPNEWARVTSLTTFQGKLFASLGSCTSSRLDAPCDFRGTVWSMEAGRTVSYDRDLGPGWKHLTAVRRGDRLELYVDGQLGATSAAFTPADYDLTTDMPAADRLRRGRLLQRQDPRSAAVRGSFDCGRHSAFGGRRPCQIGHVYGSAWPWTGCVSRTPSGELCREDEGHVETVGAGRFRYRRGGRRGRSARSRVLLSGAGQPVSGKGLPGRQVEALNDAHRFVRELGDRQSVVVSFSTGRDQVRAGERACDRREVLTKSHVPEAFLAGIAAALHRRD